MKKEILTSLLNKHGGKDNILTMIFHPGYQLATIQAEELKQMEIDMDNYCLITKQMIQYPLKKRDKLTYELYNTTTYYDLEQLVCITFKDDKKLTVQDSEDHKELYWKQGEETSNDLRKNS